MQKTVLPMAVLLVAFTAVFSAESWQTNKQEQVRQLTALAELGAAGLNSYLTQLEGSLRLAGAQMTVRERPVTMPPGVEQVLRKTYPELRKLKLVRAGDATPSASHSPFSPAAHGAMTVDPPQRRKDSGDWVIPVSYPVRDTSGEVRYAIDTALPLRTAHDLWREAPLPHEGRLGVIRDDGHLITLYPLPDAVQLERLYSGVRSASPLYAHMRANGYPLRGAVEGDGSLNGKPRLWVYRRLDGYPLTLYTSLPKAHLWQTWWLQVRYSYLLLAIGVVGGLLVYRWIFRRQWAWELARERAERHIRRLNGTLAQRIAQLEASNRELEAFSYTVSHDLRGPLRVMHGFSERLAAHSRDRLDAQGQHYLQRIQVGAQRMGALVDGLLQLSRVTRVKVEQQPVDLTHEAKSIARELAQLYPERDVEFHVDEGMTARGTPALVRDLLRNLLENAWKFTAARERPRVSFSCEQHEGERVYVVRDNGVGFDMRYATKLFTVFQRLHGADYEGTGVGLATTARIVAMHGGRIWAEAEKDRGAAFHFVLEPHA